MRRLFLGELKTTSFHREENMENLAAMNMKKTSTSAPAPAMAPATGTGCPVNLYSLSISIPDFSDCPIKKE